MTSLPFQDRNHNLRVVSTPTWPVPYYQRAFRHPGNMDQDKGDMWSICAPLDDTHVVMAKELLKLDGKGYVVEAVEQHFKLKDYMTSFKDSTQFSAAYLDDLLECLGAAHEQDVKLLSENDLSDVFNWITTQILMIIVNNSGSKQYKSKDIAYMHVSIFHWSKKLQMMHKSFLFKQI